MSRRRGGGSGDGGIAAVDLHEYELPDFASLGDGPVHPFVREVCERAGEGYRRWDQQVRRTGYCQRPIRLTGRVQVIDTETGELHSSYSTDGEPNRELLVACGNRRASRCRSCAYTYQGDAYQVVVSGMRGGKGVPEAVVGHPMAFVTFTAPGFGAVHTRRERNGRVLACRRRNRTKVCPHGVRAGCSVRHKANDPLVGQPLCLACFDAEAQVIWNALAPQLWRRTVTYLPRALARLSGLTLKEFSGRVKVRFAKVAEYQKRGAIHFHAIVRLDAAPPEGRPETVTPPPAGFDPALLEAGLRAAREAAVLDCPELKLLGRADPCIRWGTELHVRPIRTGLGQLSAEVVAAYASKYSVKDSTGLGVPDAPIACGADIDALKVPEHVRALVRAGWGLGLRAGFKDLKLADHAHSLGFGGHFLTKSRRYSTTMGALRQARRDFAVLHREGDGEETADAWADAVDGDQVVRVAEWAYLGWGFHTIGEAYLASSAAARAREELRIGREEARSYVAA